MHTSARTSSDGKLNPTPRVPDRIRKAAARVASFLVGHGAVQVIGPDGERLELPDALRGVMFVAAGFIADGRPVAVLPDERLLSTQVAADLLNVSRQYLVRLVDAGDLPAVNVGRHRRLRASDVAAYMAVRDARRASALGRLVELSEELDGYAKKG